jgi:hypothetical protein
MNTISKAFDVTKSALSAAAAAVSPSPIDIRATARAMRQAREEAHLLYSRRKQACSRTERDLADLNALRNPARQELNARDKVQVELTTRRQAQQEAEALHNKAACLPGLADRLLLADSREECGAVNWPEQRASLIEGTERSQAGITKAEKDAARLTADHAKRCALRTEALQRLAAQIDPKRALLAQAAAEVESEQKRQADAYAAAVRAGTDLPNADEQEEVLVASQRLVSRLRAQLAALEGAHATDLALHQNLSAEEQDAEGGLADELIFRRDELRRLLWDIAAGDFVSVAGEMAGALPEDGWKLCIPVFDRARIPGGTRMNGSSVDVDALLEVNKLMQVQFTVADVLDEIRSAGFGHLIQRG